VHFALNVLAQVLVVAAIAFIDAHVRGRLAAPLGSLAEKLPRSVPHDGEEPGGEAARIAQRAQVAQRAKEPLLYDVVHRACRHAHGQRNRAGFPLVAKGELLERLGAVLEHLPDDRGVGCGEEGEWEYALHGEALHPQGSRGGRSFKKKRPVPSAFSPAVVVNRRSL
jgi:hypothetical protein